MGSLETPIILRGIFRKKLEAERRQALEPLRAYLAACGLRAANLDTARLRMNPGDSTINPRPSIGPIRFMCCLPGGEPFTYQMGPGFVLGPDCQPKVVADLEHAANELDEYRLEPLDVLASVGSDITSLDGCEDWVEWIENIGMGDDMTARECREWAQNFANTLRLRQELQLILGRNASAAIETLSEVWNEGPPTMTMPEVR